MSNVLVPSASSGLTPAQIAANLRKQVAERHAAGEAPEQSSKGNPFIKFSGKDGTCTLGAEKKPMEEGTYQLLINAGSFYHGHKEWAGGNPVANSERVALMTQGPIPQPPEGAVMSDGPKKPGWSGFVGFECRIMDGPLDATSAKWESGLTTQGDEIINLASAVWANISASETDFIHPVVEVEYTSFNTSAYGKIHKPVFHIVGWCDGATIALYEDTPKSKPRTADDGVIDGTIADADTAGTDILG